MFDGHRCLCALRIERRRSLDLLIVVLLQVLMHVALGILVQQVILRATVRQLRLGIPCTEHTHTRQDKQAQGR